MNAFHSNWTKPFFLRHPGRAYFIEDYDLLTTILSALQWRKVNGAIQMVSDSTGAEYYRSLGLSHLWDLGVTTSLDILETQDISPLSFWAAGKIFALKQQAAPCVMIDTDFIVWKSLADSTHNASLAVAHREPINSVYPEKAFFNMDKAYSFPDEWDWTVLPCNTALLYIACEAFKDYYTTQSIRFMQSLRETKDIIAEMVFAEQRLLAMCATAKGIDVKTMVDTANLDSQTSFTHIWGFKRELQAEAKKRQEFCMMCARRIQSDFPEEVPVLEKIESLRAYIKEI